jgi:hypothetical protein
VTSRSTRLALLGYRLALRDRKFADSPLEGDGFELWVPRYKRCFLTLPIHQLLGVGHQENIAFAEPLQRFELASLAQPDLGVRGYGSDPQPGIREEVGSSTGAGY